jgi:hypothetical protein
VTTPPFNTVNQFIISEIQKERNFVPGGQFTDDPKVCSM